MSNLKIFTDNIEQEALNQISTLIEQPAFKDCKIRIMPDVHAGSGCVIGFTADLGDKVIPNIVGVDIGCGMLTINLGEDEINFEWLDKIVRQYVPSGKNVREIKFIDFEKLKQIHCYKHLKNVDWIERSLGTLGGGNHFIEIDKDLDNNKYLVIHSGSRNLGKQVANYYQNLAVELVNGKDELTEKQIQLIEEYKLTCRESEIQKAIEELHRDFIPTHLNIPKELCYLTGVYREQYLHDMKICQEYASLNRYVIADNILGNLFGVDRAYYNLPMFETIHNYIDHATNIVRKGAISAKKDEMLLIPINMKDGCILGKGKGNDDWNQSAPHGAGRLMSRTKAKENISLQDYKNIMSGIYTTSVNKNTIDEAPMAYKSMSEIIENIKDTVEIVSILKPVYNFKASE